MAQKPARMSGVIAASVPPAKHDVGLPAHNRRGALADRGRARRARRDRCIVRPRQPQLDRDLTARRVDEGRGNEER